MLLKECGVSRIFVGVESINGSELKAFNKNTTAEDVCMAISALNSGNVQFDCGYIFFSPWSTLSDLLRSAVFMAKVGLEHFPYGAYRMKAHPGTKALRDIESAGLLREFDDSSGEGFEEVYLRYVFKEPSVNFIWEQADFLYRKIYSFILEGPIETYAANNLLIRPKIISDMCVLGLVSDLVKSCRSAPADLRVSHPKYLARQLEKAKRSVFYDLKSLSDFSDRSRRPSH
jgi:hypothetical protein